MSGSNKIGTLFRAWHYATTEVSLSPEAKPEDICIDTGCGMTMIDRDFLSRQNPEAKVVTLNERVTVKGIGSDRHDTQEVVRLPVYFTALIPRKAGETGAGESVLLGVYTECYLVSNLRAHMLFGIDSLGRNCMNLLLDGDKPRMIMTACQNAEIPIRIKARTIQPKVKSRPVVASERTVIPAFSVETIPIKSVMPDDDDQDYIFVPSQSDARLSAHVLNSKIDWIVAKNYTARNLVISKGSRLGHIHPFGDTGSYHVDPNAHSLADNQDSSLTPVSSSNDLILENGIHIYDDGTGKTELLAEHVMKYDVWRDRGFAVVPEEDWMPIPMKDGWEQMVDTSGKLYQASARQSANRSGP
jgi:hypothetical protein